jgi:pyridinium-3,5-bisthiocarboxylic acid mononucleotide nickel chelatase
MFLGALVAAGLLEADLHDVVAPLQRAGAAFDLRVREVRKGPVAATEVRIVDQAPNVKAHLGDMLDLIRSAALSSSVREQATSILSRMAGALASHAGERVDDYVFGGTSGIDDVVAAVGVSGAMAVLGIRTVFASPVNIGVPDPVISELLGHAPMYEDSPGIPLVTPLGAAILAELTSEWPASPPFAGGAVGYGAGLRDLPRPNVMRCFLGYGTIPGATERARPTE